MRNCRQYAVTPRTRLRLAIGVGPEDVEAILTQTLDNDAEATDQHGVVLWGDEQFDEFTRLLRIPNAAHSYEDAKLEGLEGFVEHPESFVEMSRSRPRRAGTGPTLARPSSASAGQRPWLTAGGRKTRPDIAGGPLARVTSGPPSVMARGRFIAVPFPRRQAVTGAARRMSRRHNRPRYSWKTPSARYLR